MLLLGNKGPNQSKALLIEKSLVEITQPNNFQMSAEGTKRIPTVSAEKGDSFAANLRWNLSAEMTSRSSEGPTFINNKSLAAIC